MIQYERHKQILAQLELHRAMSIHRLAEATFTSESTVRRDLDALEVEGLVRRVYGGVVLTKYTGEDMPLFHRTHDNQTQKQAIAALAAPLIEDGMTLFIDASTTAFELIPHLAGRKNLTIVTNSLALTEKVGEMGEDCAQIWCTGGRYIARNRAFGGPTAARFVEGTRADLMLFSSRGLTLDGEITDTSEAESEVRRVMLARAATRVFLCTAEKIGRQYTFRLCGRGDYDRIICDQALPEALRD